MVTAKELIEILSKSYKRSPTSSTKLNQMVTDYQKIFDIHKSIRPRFYCKNLEESPGSRHLSADQKNSLRVLFAKYPDSKLTTSTNADTYVLNLIKRSLNIFRVIMCEY